MIQMSKPTIWSIVGVIIIIILVSIAGVLLNFKKSNQKDSMQIANPAAKYCHDQGYKYEIRGNESGQFGICIVNGTECEEWAFYRNECGGIK